MVTEKRSRTRGDDKHPRHRGLSRESITPLSEAHKGQQATSVPTLIQPTVGSCRTHLRPARLRWLAGRRLSLTTSRTSASSSAFLSRGIGA
jgi:hypothetical protein